MGLTFPQRLVEFTAERAENTEKIRKTLHSLR